MDIQIRKLCHGKGFLREERCKMDKVFEHKNGTQTAYSIVGHGDALLFIHGFTGGRTDWSQIADILSADYTYISYDLLGHGKTVMPDNIDLHEWAVREQLRELMLGLGYDEYSIVAHSLGGSLPMAYVLKYGCELISKVVIADMTPYMAETDDWKLGAKGGFGSKEATEMMKTDYLGYMRAFFESAVPNVQGLSEEEYTANFHAWLAPIKAKPAIAVLESCQEDLRASLEKFIVPVSYFYADPGSILPVELADYYKEHVANAPFKAVKFDCETHMFPFVYAELFTERLAEFLSNKY